MSCPSASSLSLRLIHVHAKQGSENQTQKKHTPNRKRPNKTQPTTTRPANDNAEKTKKKWREPDLGVDVEQGVRVEDGVRVQEEENTRGNPNQKSLGFPQRLREKKKENTASTKPTKQPEKEKEGTANIVANRGQVLKGGKPNTIPTPETEKKKKNQTKYPTSILKKPNKNQIQNQQSLGGLVTAGWRGPWAALHFWGVTPGDCSTEGYKYPTTTGTAPGGAKADNLPDTRRIPQNFCTST